MGAGVVLLGMGMGFWVVRLREVRRVLVLLLGMVGGLMGMVVILVLLMVMGLVVVGMDFPLGRGIDLMLRGEREVCIAWYRVMFYGRVQCTL
jgi:hypothetical protein